MSAFTLHKHTGCSDKLNRSRCHPSNRTPHRRYARLPILVDHCCQLDERIKVVWFHKVSIGTEMVCFSHVNTFHGGRNDNPGNDLARGFWGIRRVRHSHFLDPPCPIATSTAQECARSHIPTSFICKLPLAGWSWVITLKPTRSWRRYSPPGAFIPGVASPLGRVRES